MIKTRGPKAGRCNICGSFENLTEDHTPPKGCYKPRAVELLSIIDHLKAELPKKKGTISQNGVKYKTLCGRCNNKILGTECDPEFIRFVNGIGNILKSSIALPPTIIFEAKPQKIMKALVGHLSAQGVNRFNKGSITKPIRKYFLGSNECLPTQMKIYCWPYPYNRNIMVRDCALTDLNIHEPVIVWFIKFFPIAFMITFDEPRDYRFPGLELSRWRDVGFDETVKLPFGITKIPSQHWPEAPSENSIIMYGNEAIMSFEKRSR